MGWGVGAGEGSGVARMLEKMKKNVRSTEYYYYDRITECELVRLTFRHGRG